MRRKAVFFLGAFTEFSLNEHVDTGDNALWTTRQCAKPCVQLVQDWPTIPSRTTISDTTRYSAAPLCKKSRLGRAGYGSNPFTSPEHAAGAVLHTRTAPAKNEKRQQPKLLPSVCALRYLP
ncbi:hypothetical protein, partial [Agathobaculum desmolans]|uniref:hypothetical protein n=1 Tax=Agathobaculum desmolans TaxID=39484 RepID=UPI00248F29E5